MKIILVNRKAGKPGGTASAKRYFQDVAQKAGLNANTIAAVLTEVQVV
jgi:hypothetical protein